MAMMAGGSLGFGRGPTGRPGRGEGGQKEGKDIKGKKLSSFGELKKQYPGGLLSAPGHGCSPGLGPRAIAARSIGYADIGRARRRRRRRHRKVP